MPVIKDIEQLKSIMRPVIDNHPDEIKKYLKGKTGIVNIFIGLGMKVTNDWADPEVLRTAIEEILDGS